MGSNISSISRKITLACYSAIVALMIIVTNPTLAEAADRSYQEPTKTLQQQQNSKQEWQTTVQKSLAFLEKEFTGQDSSADVNHAVLSNEELKMISLINQERAKAGLNELKIDFSLVKLAQEKSRDMVDHNYFGHISERFGSIYDQLKRERIIYRVAAENLAGTSNFQKAFQYFMASPAHRSNILNPQFTRIGVGVIRGGPYGAMITQLFLG
ncbi:MAG: CAP domain-containing protein [Bacillota bacterium]